MKPSLLISALGVLLCGWALSALGQASAPTTTAPLDLNPATNCMEGLFSPDQPVDERVVPSSAVVESLRGGHCLRLRHAVVRGDLDLRTLPVNGVADNGAPRVSIKGAFVVVDSLFEGQLLAAAIGDGAVVRFDGPAVFRGTRFGPLDFSGVRFSDAADFAGATFVDTVMLDRARFDRGASFADATFAGPLFLGQARVAGTFDLGEASFDSVLRAFDVRAESVRLDGARFATTADLSGLRTETLSARRATFAAQADFSGGDWRRSARFEGAAFAGATDFTGVRFGALDNDFSQSSFAAGAGFSHARFAGSADFGGAAFSQTADFHQAVFHQAALFNAASFAGPARLSEARFLGWVDFRGARFSDVDLSGALFLPPAPNWDGAVIDGAVEAENLSSHAPWALTLQPLRRALGDGAYLHAPERQRAQTPTVHLMLLGALGAGVALIAFLMLK